MIHISHLELMCYLLLFPSSKDHLRFAGVKRISSFFSSAGERVCALLTDRFVNRHSRLNPCFCVLLLHALCSLPAAALL